MARVLVVEPDRQVRQFIAGILADSGHSVVECADASEGRQRLRGAPFDLVVTDLVLDESEAELSALTRRMLIVTLCGRRYRAQGDKYTAPRRLPEKPFRFADLRVLLTAAETSGAAFALAA